MTQHTQAYLYWMEDHRTPEEIKEGARILLEVRRTDALGHTCEVTSNGKACGLPATSRCSNRKCRRYICNNPKHSGTDDKQELCIHCEMDEHYANHILASS